MERFGVLEYPNIDTSDFVLKAIVCAPKDPFSEGYLQWRYVSLIQSFEVYEISLNSSMFGKIRTALLNF